MWAEGGDGRTAAMGGEIGAGPAVLRVRLPQPAELTVLRDGAVIATRRGQALDLDIGTAGAYRLEARIDERLWLLSNPVHLR